MLTQERLKELFHYDPDTGIFTRIPWLDKNGAIRGLGKCGGIDSEGYIRHRINYEKYKSVRYKAHQLAWFYVYGVWPDGDIDHINRIKTDNRICNLRIVTNHINRQNLKSAYKNNKTNCLGVYKKGSGYAAKIQLNGNGIHLGTFKTLEQAKNKYIEAKQRIHQGYAP
jgi:HNH endonuclease